MMKEKANQIMNESQLIGLASVTEDGFPRICMMAKLKSEGIAKVFISTGATSKKVAQFKANPKASVCCFSEHNNITLTGNVKIIEDMDVKKSLWQDWLINHFQGGIEDPNYCILQFDCCEATVWIDGIYETFSV